MDLNTSDTHKMKVYMPCQLIPVPRLHFAVTLYLVLRTWYLVLGVTKHLHVFMSVLGNNKKQSGLVLMVSALSIYEEHVYLFLSGDKIPCF